MSKVVDHRKRKRATMRNKRGGIGRPTVDVARLASAVSKPGIDPRRWVVSGTVGARDENGEFKTDGMIAPKSGPKVSESTYADELGVVVDVRLEPSGDFITARYNGISVGRFGRMLVPIRGGDEVLVLMPDGTPNSPANTIVALCSNQTAKIPTDWNNDRVLFDLNVPLEIRAPAVKIDSQNLKLNGRGVRYSSEGI